MRTIITKKIYSFFRYTTIISLVLFTLISCEKDQTLAMRSNTNNKIFAKTETPKIQNKNKYVEQNTKSTSPLSHDDITVIPQEDSLSDGVYTKFYLKTNDNHIEFNGKLVQYTDPEIDIQDINSDEYADYIIVLVSGRGSNIWTEEAHIFDGISKQEYNILDPFSYIEEHVVFSADEEKYTIYIDGQEVLIEKKTLATPPNHLFQHIQYGASYSYEIKNNKLICNIGCMVGPAETCGYFNIHYIFTENKFVPNSILYFD